MWDCYLIIRFPVLLKSPPLRLSSGRTFPATLLFRSSNLDIIESTQCSKLLFRHVRKSGCCCCCWLKLAFSLTKRVGENVCNIDNSPEWVWFFACSKETIMITRENKRWNGDISNLFFVLFWYFLFDGSSWNDFSRHCLFHLYSS